MLRFYSVMRNNKPHFEIAEDAMYVGEPLVCALCGTDDPDVVDVIRQCGLRVARPTVGSNAAAWLNVVRKEGAEALLASVRDHRQPASSSALSTLSGSSS